MEYRTGWSPNSLLRRICLLHVSFALVLLALAAGCSKPGSTSAGASTPVAAAGGGAGDVSAQIARGQKLYGQYCAGCHGNAGQGSGGAPAVVGKSALPLDPPSSAKARQVKFRTALDVGKWVMKNMPAKKPGTLAADEYLAILAFDLKANGVALSAPLTVQAAGKIVLHP